MSVPNRKEHAYRRVQQLNIRAKLTPQELADRAQMSINTVKKVLNGAKEGEKEAHLNSTLKVERELERYLKALQEGQLEEHKLILSGDLSKDVLTLAKELAKSMQELIFDSEKAQAIDRDALDVVLKSCNGNFKALFP